MTDAPAPRGRLQLALVALAFLGTPLAATLWFAFGDKGHHGDTVNKGALVEPPRPLADAAALGLLDRWTLVVVAPAGCGAECEATLVTLRQVRLTLARDIDRVGRVLVSGQADADAARLAAAHPDLAVRPLAEAPALAAALAGLAPAQRTGGAGRAFVVDPLGNLMMTYAPGPAPADVQSDLKRLLKVSEPWMR